MNERSIFLAALEIADQAGRTAYLDKACGSDEAVRRSVEELLAAHGKPGTFMPGPAAGQATGEWPAAEAPGTRVGPYKLLQLVGEGGMGAVYMAEQEEPIRRLVAVKIIRAGMDSKAILARFEAERQALAMMDHPHIAKVLDTGTTDSGRPFFVMELVKGVPVTKFCDEHQLTLRERLELFVPICQAIQHAHQKGVIHRDIKPSNVLVALYDDKPVPKVIDFGVAKATNQKLTEKTLFTAFGSVVGTLEYMSPEQAKLNQLDIDTRSDVYGLGVLLYELLTGTTPLESSRLKSAAFDEVLRLIREEEPPRPSARLSTASTRPAIAAARRTEPIQLGKALSGELDWIVLKALEKDRTRRYETANGLARDIQRYLSDEPVEACPPTVGYKLRKAYRKNKAAVGVAAGFLVVLTVAAAVSTVLAIQATRSRRLAVAAQQRAEEEKQTAQAVRDFLQKDLLLQASLFDQAEALRQSGGDFAVKPNPTVNELLDRAAAQLTPEKIEAKFPKQPFVQAEVLKTVGDAYFSISNQQQGADLLKRAVELYRAARGPDDPATLAARFKVAMTLIHAGRLDEARAQLESVREAQVRVCGPHHRDTFETRMGLAAVTSFQNRHADAAAQFRQLRDEARSHFGSDDVNAVHAAGCLAQSLRRAGRAKEAVQEMEVIRDTFRRLNVRADHPGYQAMIDELALAYSADGRKQQALALYEEALAAWERAGDPLNPATWLFRHQATWWKYMETGQEEAAIVHFEKNLVAATNIGHEATTRESLYKAYLKLGRGEEALSQAQKSYEAQLKHYGPDHRSWARGRARLFIGQALARLNSHAEAEPWLVEGYDEMLQHKAQMPAYDQSLIAGGKSDILDLYQAMNKPDEAKKWEARQAAARVQEIEEVRKALSPNSPDFFKTTASLAQMYLEADQKEEAIKLFEATHARCTASGWPLDDKSLTALNDLRRVAERAGRNDLAIAMMTAIVAELRKLPSPPQNVLSRHLFGLGFYLSKDLRYAEAEPCLRESLEIQTKLDPGVWYATKIKMWLAFAVLSQKKYAEAEPLLLETYRESAERIAEAPAWETHFPITAADRLIKLYTATGKADEVAKWQAKRVSLLLKEGKTPAILKATQSLTSTYIAEGQYSKAAQSIEQVLAGTDDEVLLEPLSATLVNLYQALERLEEVKKWSERRIPVLQEHLQKAQAAAAQNPTEVRNAAHMLAWAYAHADRSAEAIQQFDKSIHLYKSKGWPSDKVALNSIASFCRAAARAGDPERGIEVTSSILADLRQQPNPPQDVIAAQLYTLGFLLSEAGRHDEAETHLRKALEFQDQQERHLWSTSRTRLFLATALLAQKKYTEAEPLLLACHSEMSLQIQTALLWEKQFLHHAAQRLIELYTALDKPEQAAKWRAEEAKRRLSTENSKSEKQSAEARACQLHQVCTTCNKRRGIERTLWKL